MKEKSGLDNLLDVLMDVGLDINWLIAITSLATQEVAIKRKLNDLGASYGEEDFQKIVEKLVNIMKEKMLDVPEILLSISRSYRHIRAKLIHAPHKTKLAPEEANAIFNNTEALVRTLFKKEVDQLDISKFVGLIDKLSLDKMLKEFNNFDAKTKKLVFETILDKISILGWKEIEMNEAMFEFLRNALKTELGSLQTELFDILLHKTLVVQSFCHEKLLYIIADLTKLSSIRSFIKDKDYMGLVIAEFEMSGSWAIAAANAGIILNLSPFLDDRQVIRVVEAALSNDQIISSLGARSSLKRFLAMYRDKIPKDKLEKLLRALE